MLGHDRAAARGLPAALTPDPFEMLVGAITAQQVSLFSALAIRNRLVERFGVQVGEAWSFPSRERIAAATRRSSSRSASRAARRSTSSGSRAPTSTSTRSRRCPTTRCVRGSSRCADSGSGRPSGSSRATSPARTRGRAGDLALRKAVAPLYRGLDVRDARTLSSVRESHPRTTSCSPTACRDPPSDHRRSAARARAVAGVHGRDPRGRPWRDDDTRRISSARAGGARGDRAPRRRRRSSRSRSQEGGRARRLSRRPVRAPRRARHRRRRASSMREAAARLQERRAPTSLELEVLASNDAGARGLRPLGVRAGRADARGADRRARAASRRGARGADVRARARADRRRRRRRAHGAEGPAAARPVRDGRRRRSDERLGSPSAATSPTVSLRSSRRSRRSSRT